LLRETTPRDDAAPLRVDGPFGSSLRERLPVLRPPAGRPSLPVFTFGFDDLRGAMVTTP